MYMGSLVSCTYLSSSVPHVGISRKWPPLLTSGSLLFNDFFSGWKCARCDLRENLWLNLTDGSVLCGKWFFDSSGGNGHALEHYRDMGYPLAVKLGTITPDGAGECAFTDLGNLQWLPLHLTSAFFPRVESGGSGHSSRLNLGSAHLLWGLGQVFKSFSASSSSSWG